MNCTHSLEQPLNPSELPFDGVWSCAAGELGRELQDLPAHMCFSRAIGRERDQRIAAVRLSCYACEEHGCDQL